MKKDTGSRSSLFLAELLFCIVAFALCMTVCARLLVQAHTVNQKSQDLTAAVRLATNAAEEFRAAPREGENSYREDGFTVTVEATRADGLLNAHIVVRSARGQVYTLDCAGTEVGHE